MNRHRIGCLVYLPKRSDDLLSVDDTKRECLRNWNLNLRNIILHPLDHIFIDPHFIRKAPQRQVLRFGKIQDFPIFAGNLFPWPLVESLDIPAGGLYMECAFPGAGFCGFFRKNRCLGIGNLNEEAGIILKMPPRKCFLPEAWFRRRRRAGGGAGIFSLRR